MADTNKDAVSLPNLDPELVMDENQVEDATPASRRAIVGSAPTAGTPDDGTTTHDEEGNDSLSENQGATDLESAPSADDSLALPAFEDIADENDSLPAPPPPPSVSDLEDAESDAPNNETESSAESKVVRDDPDSTVVLDALNEDGSVSGYSSQKGSRLKETMKASRKEARKAEKRAKKMKIVGYTGVAVLSVGALAGLFAFGWHQYKSTVSTVPAAVSKISASSKDNSLDPCQKFKQAGLECKTSWKIKDGTKRGDLISQSVKAGQQVKRGSGVNLVYSDGPSETTFPEVVGMSLDDAKQALFEAGMDIEAINVVESPGTAENTITKSSIAAGAKVANGNPVTLEVANGKVSVPDWSGKTKDFVEADAKKKGVKVKFIEEDSKKTPGTVLSQTPKAGESASSTEVVVTVAKTADAKELTVPDVVGKSVENAQSELAATGFQKISTVKVANCAVSSSQVTQVVPAAGSKTANTTDITIIVSDPDAKCGN
jgi:beta-lactam-binding protein with PASTA domain